MFPYIPNKPHNFYLYSCTFHLSLQTNYYLYYFTPFSLHLPVTIFFITISLFCTIDFILHSPLKKKKTFIALYFILFTQTSLTLLCFVTIYSSCMWVILFSERGRDVMGGAALLTSTAVLSRGQTATDWNLVPMMYAKHPFDRMSHILYVTDVTHHPRDGCHASFTWRMSCILHVTDITPPPYVYSVITIVGEGGPKLDTVSSWTPL